MTLDQFIERYLGKKVDYDNFYGGQCVDLYRQYVKDVLGYPQSPGVGGAAEIWDTADPKYYDKIPNTPSGVPNKGDIIIWNRRVGGGFGHVAIFLYGDVNSFTSLDQNWPTLDLVTKTQHTYSSVIGWLRPKETMADPLQECLRQHTVLVDETIALKKQIEALKAEKEAVQVDIDNMRREYEEKLKLKDVELQGLLAIETKLQQEKDGRREDQLKFDMRRLDLEGEIEKLRQQIASEDLSLRDYQVLINALLKKVMRYIESIKK